MTRIKAGTITAMATITAKATSLGAPCRVMDWTDLRPWHLDILSQSYSAKGTRSAMFKAPGNIVTVVLYTGCKCISSRYRLYNQQCTMHLGILPQSDLVLPCKTNLTMHDAKPKFNTSKCKVQSVHSAKYGKYDKI